MTVTMVDTKIATLEQVRTVLDGSEGLAFKGAGREQRFGWIESVLNWTGFSRSSVRAEVRPPGRSGLLEIDNGGNLSESICKLCWKNQEVNSRRRQFRLRKFQHFSMIGALLAQVGATTTAGRGVRPLFLRHSARRSRDEGPGDDTPVVAEFAVWRK